MLYTPYEVYIKTHVYVRHGDTVGGSTAVQCSRPIMLILVLLIGKSEQLRRLPLAGNIVPILTLLLLLNDYCIPD